MKKPKMGGDPLSWIQDSRELDKQKSKQEVQSLHDLQQLQSKQVLNEKNKTREPEKASQLGLKEGWTRATFIIREELLEKLKNLSYWDRKPIKEIINDILASYLKDKQINIRPKNKS
jgi:hypothetical protein